MKFEIDNIKDHNHDDLCCVKACSKPQTHALIYKMYGLTFTIGICKDHCLKLIAEWQDELFKK